MTRQNKESTPRVIQGDVFFIQIDLISWFWVVVSEKVLQCIFTLNCQDEVS